MKKDYVCLKCKLYPNRCVKTLRVNYKKNIMYTENINKKKFKKIVYYNK